MELKPTCSEAHRLTSEGLDWKLSIIDHARMRVHFPVRVVYRNFAGQMRLIRRAMRQLRVADESGTERELK
jgi:hypothetical protein